MRINWIVAVIAMLSAGSLPAATTQPAYAPLVVRYEARLGEEKKALPLLTIGRLPAEATSPLKRGAIDADFYASFRDNQLGQNARDDANASAFAHGKLALRPAVEGTELVAAVSLDLPDASATVGPVVVENNKLVIPIDVWRANENVDRAKSVSARHVEMLYLPGLAIGKYVAQVQWRQMRPAAPGNGSGYVWTDYKVGETTLDVRAASASEQTPDAVTMDVSALHAVSMPRSADDARTQTPWLITARRFAQLGDAKEGVVVGSGDVFRFLRGNPGESQVAAALPKLDPPDSNQSLYARIIGPDEHRRVDIGRGDSLEGQHGED